MECAVFTLFCESTIRQKYKNKKVPRFMVHEKGRFIEHEFISQCQKLRENSKLGYLNINNIQDQNATIYQI